MESIATEAELAALYAAVDNKADCVAYTEYDYPQGTSQH